MAIGVLIVLMMIMASKKHCCLTHTNEEHGGFNCNGEDSLYHRPQVFITVNAVSHVSWAGNKNSRNLVLNWIKTEERRAADWVGLFDYDIDGEEVLRRKKGDYIDPPGPGRIEADQAKVSVSVDNNRDSYRKTEIPFPTRMYEDNDSCLGYYIAYVRGIKVMAVNCLKTNPFWMTKMKDYIGLLPIRKLLIPGTHHSLKIHIFDGYFANTIEKRWSYTQEESVWNQLVMGIRFLDVTVNAKNSDLLHLLTIFKENINKTLPDSKLKGRFGTFFRDVLKFCRLSKDVVIINLKLVREQVKDKDGPRLIRKLILSLLGEFLLTFEGAASFNVSFNDCLKMRKNLILAYQEIEQDSGEEIILQQLQMENSTQAKHFRTPSFIWPAIPMKQIKDNSVDARTLDKSLKDLSRNSSKINYFSAMVTALKPSALDLAADIIDFRRGGVRYNADRMAPFINRWFIGRGWDQGNIVASDFFLSNNLVETAITVNVKRSLCFDSIS